MTFLFVIGHGLEAATMNKTRSALTALIAVAPDVAVVLRDGQQQQIPADQVRAGEIVLVKNGAKVPVDGKVVAGTGAIDEASITGESMPVTKAASDQVFAGTISRGGFLQVKHCADRKLLWRGLSPRGTSPRCQQKPKHSSTVSTWYTPAVFFLALLIGLVTQDVVLALTLLWWLPRCPAILSRSCRRDWPGCT